MTVQVTGLKELNKKLRKLGGNMDKAIDGGVYVTAQGVRTDAAKAIQEVSPGRPTTRGGKAHVAAAAGYAPNTDTGGLVKSLAVEKRNPAEYEVGSNLDYARAQELGTTFMQPRPFLNPALEKNRKKLVENVSKVTDALIKKASK